VGKTTTTSAGGRLTFLKLCPGQFQWVLLAWVGMEFFPALHSSSLHALATLFLVHSMVM